MIDSDAKKLSVELGDEFEMVFPNLVSNVEASRRVGEALRCENVDMVLMYHATYVDEAMMGEIGNTVSVLFHFPQLSGYRQLGRRRSLLSQQQSGADLRNLEVPVGSKLRLRAFATS